ncbi:hypothetical protein HMPREF9104_01381 [Lentilactobacillus kisonensis F0435]|uniref:Uncharacterized protein n=1 Tax=Lentilactobacillus kisonensis F0435 TaxID=797516 RepID=H1LFK5_9LACO|nr:hypothetical protein HMPREF9104_01381 [Lentilactobacillus kisonensis F0435]
MPVIVEGFGVHIDMTSLQHRYTMAIFKCELKSPALNPNDTKPIT